MRKQFLYLLALVAVIGLGCQKEVSFELGDTPAEGSLQSDLTGDCLPKTVNGTYAVGVPLVPTANTITVSVNVTRTGTYTITTDTVNGFYFRGIGQFINLGPNTVTLRGNGTPFANGSFNFVVSFDSTVCDIQVDVTQPGVGTLGGAPATCAPITVNGGYSPGIALTAGNNAAVQVNVTTPGAFNITTDTVAGIWFSFTGNLTASQTVTLQAQGAIPAATTIGSKTFTVKLGTSSCTFVVNVAGPAVGTVDCSSATFTGSFTAGQPVTGSTAQISAIVTTPGVYNITTDTVNGVWFNASGNFATAATVPLTLNANGVATSAGPFTYTVKWGTSTCTFSCTFAPALSNDYFPRTTGSNWSYEYDDVSTDSLYRNVISPTITALGNPFNIFMQNDGITPPPDSSGYYRKNGGDYFEWVNLEDYGADLPLWIEYIMLKDNVAALTNWKTPSAGVTAVIGGTPTKIRFSNTILQKDVPISITTSASPTPVTYNNVIVVEQKIEAEILPGVWQDLSALLGSGKSYYARGIGLIKFELTSFIGNITQELRRYQVL